MNEQRVAGPTAGRRPGGFLATVAVAVVIGLAAAAVVPPARAQTDDTGVVVEETQDMSGSYGSESSGERRQRTRSVFLSLFATHFIPGIAEGLSGWFRERLFGGGGGGSSSGNGGGGGANGGGGGGGEVVAAGEGSDGAPALVASASAPGGEGGIRSRAVAGAGAAGNAGGPAMHAGIAYEVLLLSADGGKTSIDPARHVFRSGERFEVAYRPNFPGVVEVYNIDPTGKVELIDKLRLQAAELGSLGPYEFVGEKGEDLLRIVLHPCKAGALTRGIARVEMRPEVERALQGCDEAERAPAQVATRSIAKVAREGGTAFALDPVSRSEIDSGRLAPREVVLRFRHE